RRIDHPENTEPGGDPVQIAQLPLEAAKNGETREPRGLIAILYGNFAIHFPQSRSESAVRILGSVPRNIGSISANANECKRQVHPYRRLQSGRQNQTQSF